MQVPAIAAAERAEDARDDAIDAASQAALYSNAVRYETYAQMESDLANQPIGKKAEVWGDLNIALNGFYNRANTTWEWAEPQPASAARLEDLEVRFGETTAEVLVLSSLAPLHTDQAGNVPLWVQNGRVAGVGIQETVTVNAQQGAFPLWASTNGKVPAWLEGGAFAVARLADSFKEKIREAVADRYAPRNVPSGATAPLATDSRSLFAFRGNLARILRAGEGVARVLLVGDSWAQRTEIAQPLTDLLYDAYGHSGNGWIPSYSGYELNGYVVSRSGTWTLYDASNIGGVPPYGCGIDGHCYYTSGSDGAWSVANCVFTEFKLFYWDTNGSFRWRIDEGAWTTVVCGGSNTLKYVDIAGVADAAHKVEMDNSVNTGGGVVTLIGGYATRSAVAGVELSKCGNGGQTGAGMLQIAGYIEPYVDVMQPDLVVMVLGTNDYRLSYATVSKYKQALQMWIDGVRDRRPQCGFVFVVPPQSNAAAAVPLSQYRDAAYEIALSNGVELLNVYDYWGAYPTMNALGHWVDDLHCSMTGGEHISRFLQNKHLSF